MLKNKHRIHISMKTSTNSETTVDNRRISKKSDGTQNLFILSHENFDGHRNVKTKNNERPSMQVKI